MSIAKSTCYLTNCLSWYATVVLLHVSGAREYCCNSISGYSKSDVLSTTRRKQEGLLFSIRLVFESSIDYSNVYNNEMKKHVFKSSSMGTPVLELHVARRILYRTVLSVSLFWFANFTVWCSLNYCVSPGCIVSPPPLFSLLFLCSCL